MSTNATDSESLHADQNAKVLNLLNQILALPDQQRSALGKAWAAMETAFGLNISQDDTYSVKVDEENSVVDPNEVGRLNAWIDKQQTLPAKDRIAKLQYELDCETEEWAMTLLNAEIVKVKNSHPWLAAEIAVMKYAYERPVLMTVALAGLGLGIYRLFKTIFKIIF